MNDEKSIGKKVDEVVEKAKAKIAAAHGDAKTIARDISKGVKRAVEDTGDAITDLINKGK